MRDGDPTTVAGYRLIARLGAGGMGRVYLARSSGGRPVALKVIRSDLADDVTFQDRFAREVAAARSVSGVFTAPVLDADPRGDPPWLATGYVAGIGLGDAVDRFGPLPHPAVSTLAAGVAEAVAAVHAAGLIHRDVKPSNIMLSADGPKLIDFGIARQVAADSGNTLTGTVIGSPAFLSPEQITGAEVGPAADMFALASVLVFALTGRPPFAGDNQMALLYAVVNAEPQLGGVPGSIVGIVNACLAKDPRHRPGPAQLIELLRSSDPHPAGGTDHWHLPGPLAREIVERSAALLGPTSFSPPATDLDGRSGRRPVAPPAAAPLAAPASGTGSSRPGSSTQQRYGLGVDLGTTHTAAAVWRDGLAAAVPLGGRSHSVPSVLFLREDGSLLVGDAASRRGITEVDRVVSQFKRRFGDTTPYLVADREFTADQLTGHLLRWVVEAATEREGLPPAHVTLTHPATWRTYRIELLVAAARNAGLEAVGLLPEPVAAAAYYASTERLDTDDLLGVYDLGGGTFDASVIRKTPDGFAIHGDPTGDDYLGGIDIDQAVMDHVMEALPGGWPTLDIDDPAVLTALAQVRDHATAAKEALSTDTEAVVPVILPGLFTHVRITRGELEHAIRPQILHTVGLLARTITSAGATPADLSAVLLTGGSSRIPLVSRLIAAELGIPVALDAHPKYATSLGAAIATGARLAPVSEVAVPDPHARTVHPPSPGSDESSAPRIAVDLAHTGILARIDTTGPSPSPSVDDPAPTVRVDVPPPPSATDPVVAASTADDHAVITVVATSPYRTPATNGGTTVDSTQRPTTAAAGAPAADRPLSDAPAALSPPTAESESSVTPRRRRVGLLVALLGILALVGSVIAIAAARPGTEATGAAAAGAASVEIARLDQVGYSDTAVAQLDGRPVIISGGQDRTARMWDAATRMPVGHPLTGHTDVVRGVATGELDARPVIVSAGAEKTVRVWDMATQEPIGEPITVGTDEFLTNVTTVATARLGNQPLILTGAQDSMIRVWDMATHQQVGKPLNNYNIVSNIAAAEVDGKPVAIAAGSEATVRVWDLATHQEIGQPLTGPVTDVYAVATAELADRTVVVASSSSAIWVWDLATRQLVGTPIIGHTGKIFTLTVTQLDGRPVIVSGGEDRTVRLWDLATGQPVGQPITGHTDAVRSVVTTRLDATPVLVSTGNDQTIRLWDLAAAARQTVPAPPSPGGPARTLTGHTDALLTVAVAQLDGRAVAVSGGADRTIRRWDVSTGQPVGEPITGHTGSINEVAVAQLDGRPVIVAASDDTTIRRWDLATGQPVGEPITGHTGRVFAVATAELGGKPIIISGSGGSLTTDYTIRRWDLATGQPIGEPIVSESGGSFFEVPTAQLGGRPIVIGSGGSNKTIGRWDLESGQPIGPPIPEASNALATAQLDGRAVIVSGYEDGDFRVWDMATGQPIGQPTSTGGDPNDIATTELNGRPIVLAALSSDEIRLFDLASGAAIGQPLTGHTDIVWALATTQVDGKPVLVSGSWDATVRIWNLAG